MTPVKFMRGWTDTARPLGGQELDLQTQLRVGGETVWSEISTFLARRTDRSRTPHTREGGLPHLEVPPRQDVNTSTFVVSPGVGRQYARIFRGLQSHSHRGCRGPLFWLQTRGRTRHVVACTLRCRTSADPHFQGLAHWMWLSGDPFRSAPAAARELDGRPTRGIHTCAIRRPRATICPEG